MSRIICYTHTRIIYRWHSNTRTYIHTHSLTLLRHSHSYATHTLTPLALLRFSQTHILKLTPTAMMHTPTTTYTLQGQREFSTVSLWSWRLPWLTPALYPSWTESHKIWGLSGNHHLPQIALVRMKTWISVHIPKEITDLCGIGWTCSFITDDRNASEIDAVGPALTYRVIII